MNFHPRKRIATIMGSKLEALTWEPFGERYARVVHNFESPWFSCVPKHEKEDGWLYATNPNPLSKTPYASHSLHLNYLES